MKILIEKNESEKFINVLQDVEELKVHPFSSPTCEWNADDNDNGDDDDDDDKQ